jgi:hypothetical protein
VKLLDRGLITQKFRNRFARSLNKSGIKNYFRKGNLMDSLHGRRRGQEGAMVQRGAHRSEASSHSGAQKLTGGGRKERGEHRGPFLGLIRA